MGAIRCANGETWVALSEIEQRVKDKMEQVGTPLKDWDVSINRGIVTGYNNAFIIDAETRDALIASDPKSAEIIKPVLRGRDIQRYSAKWAGLYLIYARKGIDFTRYPAVYRHMESHRDGLERKRGANKWYELQASPSAKTDALLPKDKIVWGNLANRPKFAYAAGGTVINAPSTMLTPYDPYLLAVLNSSLVDWYFKLIGVERDGGYYEYKPMFIERIPVPPASASKRAELAGLVERILSAKASVGRASASGMAGRASASGLAGRASASGMESQVDELVLELYGLSAAESAAISRSLSIA